MDGRDAGNQQQWRVGKGNGHEMCALFWENYSDVGLDKSVEENLLRRDVKI